MVRFEVFRETKDLDSRGAEGFAVETWLSVEGVFAVTAHEDDAWSVITFRPGTAPRSSLTVRGTAETIAALITAERWQLRLMSERSSK